MRLGASGEVLEVVRPKVGLLEGGPGDGSRREGISDCGNCITKSL